MSLRLVHVTLPRHGGDGGDGSSKDAGDPGLLMAVVEILRRGDHVHGVALFHGPVHSLVVFRCVQKHLAGILEALENLGVPSCFGRVDIMAILATKPALARVQPTQKSTRWKKLRKDRMTTEEIYGQVDSGNHLTFDYMAMICIAAVLAAVGLVTDSAVTVVASMLVSPLMGPIVASTFAMAIRDLSMFRRGMRNEFVGFVICIVIGAVAGCVVAPFYGPGGVNASWANQDLDKSDQIASRGDPLSLIPGTIIAIVSGAGVALAVTGGGINALVGVAIAAALLPPIVNSGLCFTVSMFQYIEANAARGVQNASGAHDERSNERVATKFLYFSLYSSLLFLCNYLMITVLAFAVFKLKSIGPIPRRPTRMVVADDHAPSSEWTAAGSEAESGAELDPSSLLSFPGPRGGVGERGLRFREVNKSSSLSVAEGDDSGERRAAHGSSGAERRGEQDRPTWGSPPGIDMADMASRGDKPWPGMDHGRGVRDDTESELHEGKGAGADPPLLASSRTSRGAAHR